MTLDTALITEIIESMNPIQRDALIKDSFEMKGKLDSSLWPKVYTNKQTGTVYRPHNEQEHDFVFTDSPKYKYLKGGEGAGKSVAGIIKTLNRLKRGMNGIMVSTDLQHFKKSLWVEFTNWCPKSTLILKHQTRLNPSWDVGEAFTLVFYNDLGGFSTLICGGAKEDQIGSWEGPNVHFVFFDEARKHKTPEALKVFTGRIRLSGPNQEPPEFFITSTPRKHWLFDYFGPLKEDDPFKDFKETSKTYTLRLDENAKNLDPSFIEDRKKSLSDNEISILVNADWADENLVNKFVNMIWWDSCLDEKLPPLKADEPCVLSLDASKGGATNDPDDFALALLSRHPNNKEHVAIRYFELWKPHTNITSNLLTTEDEGMIVFDYEEIEKEIIRLCTQYTVIEIVYDPYQLHYFCTQLRKKEIGLVKEFGQKAARTKADKQFQTMILSRKFWHNGDERLRKHIDNADAQILDEGRSIRLIKRSPSLKIDGAVACSQGIDRILYYNLEE